MPINTDQLMRQLKENVAPIYHIHGDELLLLQEAKDAIREAAKANGADEHHTFLVTPDIDWQHVSNTLSQSGLFANKQCIDCTHPTGKFDKKAIFKRRLTSKSPKFWGILQ